MPAKKLDGKTKKQANIFTRSPKTDEKLPEASKSGSRFTESYTSLILGIVVVVIATVLLLSFARNKNLSSKTSVEQKTSSAKTANEVNIKKVLNNEHKNVTPTQTAKVAKKSEPAKVAKKAKPMKAQEKISSTLYVVKENDTLWKIAEKTYKSGYNWVDIAKANKLANPGMISKGMKLKLPKISPKLSTVTVAPKAAPKTMAKKTPVTGKAKVAELDQTKIEKSNKISGASYMIQKGDTLWSIAVRAYGDGYQWVKIAKSNDLLNNPGLIHSGNSLKIPRG